MTDAMTVHRPRRDGPRRAAAVGTAVIVAVACLVAAVLRRDDQIPDGPSLLTLVSVLVVTATGLAVAWMRPRNAIGWLLMGVPGLQVLSLVAAAYAQLAYAADPRLRGSLLAAWTAEWTWFPSLALPLAVLPSIYPSGRAESRLRRLLVRCGWLGTLGMCLELGLVLGPSDIAAEARLPYTAPNWVGVVVLVPTLALLVTAIVGGLVAVLVRTVRSSDPERQQLVWLIGALTTFPVIYFTEFPGYELLYSLFRVAVAVGVLRYRLLDIRIVLQRTLFYVPLVALIAVVVAGMSTVIARVAPSGPLPLLGAASAVAVLVGPVSSSLRRSVDRFVLGDRADPLSAVGRVTARGELTATGDTLTSLLHVLTKVVGVPYAAVLSSGGEPVASVGEPAARTLRLSLQVDRSSLGSLVVSEPSDTAGSRIVAALVPHVANVVHTQRLTAELEVERQRAVSATTAERERIRSDLHDGLGPSLSGISLSLQAVEAALGDEDPATLAIVARARDEADSAGREVRRVLGALAPTGLDRRGLVDAVTAAAGRLGLDGTTGPTFSCLSQDLVTLPRHVEETAYRIAGEALHNVARHSHASSCEIHLASIDGHLEVRISDDGVGIVDSPRPGLGLESMRRRALAAGGTFTVSRPDDEGTVVRARLPLEPRP